MNSRVRVTPSKFRVTSGSLSSGSLSSRHFIFPALSSQLITTHNALLILRRVTSHRCQPSRNGDTKHLSNHRWYSLDISTPFLLYWHSCIFCLSSNRATFFWCSHPTFTNTKHNKPNQHQTRRTRNFDRRPFLISFSSSQSIQGKIILQILCIYSLFHSCSVGVSPKCSRTVQYPSKLVILASQLSRRSIDLKSMHLQLSLPVFQLVCSLFSSAYVDLGPLHPKISLLLFAIFTKAQMLRALSYSSWSRINLNLLSPSEFVLFRSWN